MTSKGDTLKTNEFLRLRKLRLQQVREQSKDIAKKIRQRAKGEQLRHVSSVDTNKEKVYLQRQEKLVSRLEQLYAKGIESVGAGHKNANEINKKDFPENKDLSKLRGREAVAELRKKKQQKLDEQKKLLDRKLQAREAANELSREKSVAVVNSLTKSSSSKSVNGPPEKSIVNEQLISETNVNIDEGGKEKVESVTKNDMGTQWDFEEIPHEWDPYIPALSIPKDDSVKNLASDNVEKSDKSKRLNLFALSDEMPSSLRGGVASIPDDRVPLKPSLTLVSEYLQNRGLRLREPDTTQKKSSEDLQNIKQTLLKTRASRTDVTGRSNTAELSSKLTDINSALNKKNSVTMYDHSTRNIKDMPHNVEKLVVRDTNNDEDAYSQALKESSIPEHTCTPSKQKAQEQRNRVAMAKQNVDKEYRDTLAFLNSLPRERATKSMKTAYMDGDRQQEMKDRRQQRMQQEYKKACSKHHCKHLKCKTTLHDYNRSKSKSPVSVDEESNIISRDFQYSWLPVPESDGSLAIHTVSNNAKDKPGNTVKFSSVDTYHEYRSRHKHTPPTKDVTTEQPKRVVEAVIMQDNDDGIDSSSETDSSSVNNLQDEIDNVNSHRTDKHKQLDDAEKIIIYKVIDAKKNKNKKSKRKSEIRNLMNEIQNDQKSQDQVDKDNMDDINKNTVSFTQLKEGVYKTVSAQGDNISCMYFSDDQQESRRNQHKQHANDAGALNENGEKSNKLLNRSAKSPGACKCTNTAHEHCDKHPSAATSTSSFKTASNEKASHGLPDGGFIKFVDNGGQDAGKFYVGASGFLKDDAYEVVIQLRKKEAEKMIQSQDNVAVQNNYLAHKNIINDDLGQKSKEFISSKISEEYIQQNNLPKEKSFDSVPIEVDKAQQPEQNEDSKKSTQPESNDNLKQNAPTVECPKVHDKAVCTSFRDSFVIPENAPKLDPIPKQAASTYTQTTNSSPIARPLLMHLSSSTSTTYMSPPELVLPRYFRNGSAETYDENSSNLERQYSKQKDCKSCKCGKSNKQHKHSKVDTPPNTMRSTDQTDDNFDKQQGDKKYPESKHRVKTTKPHKCKNRSEPKICSKQKFKRSSSDYKRTYTGSNYSTLSSHRSRIVKNSSKINLNPLIENYVKKLLALNKQGLKAIEVVNQECSEVPTPGSSIIEVPSNLGKRQNAISNNISLEQIKNSLKAQILKSIDERKISLKSTLKTTGSQTDRNPKSLPKVIKRRTVHKVKSLNISKQLLKAKDNRRYLAQNNVISTSPISDYSRNDKSSEVNSSNEVSNTGAKTLLTSRKMKITQESLNNTSYSDTNNHCIGMAQHKSKGKPTENNTKIKTSTRNVQNKTGHTFQCHRATTARSSDSEVSNTIHNRRNLSTPPISISTQTNQVDSEVEFMKLAENKLQNMEKIADLTEKCTKRLSNLAKVLEEVRKHKSLAYSQISTSDSTSDTDQRSEKNVPGNNRVHSFNPTVEIQTLAEALSSLPTSPHEPKKDVSSNSPPFIPVLVDIPKPDSFKTLSPISLTTTSDKGDATDIVQQPLVKNRGRPPPALTRINLKNVPDDFVIPHELSTVVEVDSPMSVKFKNHTARPNSNNDISQTESVEDNLVHEDGANKDLPNKNMSVDLNLVNTLNILKGTNKTHSTDSSDDSKIKMMDIKQFNEIMLKPFISLKDYAKQYNVDEPDDGSIHNRVSKDEHVNEDLSSLHSDASIPDIVAELLKRNLISEPFKFETTSATVSSDSTMSMLALSRTRKDKKKSGILLKNKENMAETSESLSISSNPDLEHAFQRLGMGWASSTLKKTKERLALSSSSNTSSSSMSQFKIKNFNYQDMPEISKNSIMLNISNNQLRKSQQSDDNSETAKNALQQTSLTNSMTVKEFLANEVAKKITFSNKSNKNTTEDEFLTLCETKMPDEMKQLSHLEGENKKSLDNVPSSSNVRARTSTPVQIFKSMTYHSTSSSNTSNGLFSNADDLSSVKVTSNSNKNHSTSDKDDLTIPNYSLKLRKGLADCSKSD